MKNIVEDLQYLSLYTKLGSLIYRAEDLPLNRLCWVRPLTVNNFHERHILCKVLQSTASRLIISIFVRKTCRGDNFRPKTLRPHQILCSYTERCSGRIGVCLTSVLQDNLR